MVYNSAYMYIGFSGTVGPISIFYVIYFDVIKDTPMHLHHLYI